MKASASQTYIVLKLREGSSGAIMQKDHGFTVRPTLDCRVQALADGLVEQRDGGGAVDIAAGQCGDLRTTVNMEWSGGESGEKAQAWNTVRGPGSGFWLISASVFHQKGIASQLSFKTTAFSDLFFFFKEYSTEMFCLNCCQETQHWWFLKQVETTQGIQGCEIKKKYCLQSLYALTWQLWLNCETARNLWTTLISDLKDQLKWMHLLRISITWSKGHEH